VKGALQEFRKRILTGNVRYHESRNAGNIKERIYRNTRGGGCSIKKNSTIFDAGGMTRRRVSQRMPVSGKERYFYNPNQFIVNEEK
jgi:hypothetical protein